MKRYMNMAIEGPGWYEPVEMAHIYLTESGNTQLVACNQDHKVALSEAVDALLMKGKLMSDIELTIKWKTRWFKI